MRATESNRLIVGIVSAGGSAGVDVVRHINSSKVTNVAFMSSRVALTARLSGAASPRLLERRVRGVILLHAVHPRLTWPVLGHNV